MTKAKPKPSTDTIVTFLLDRSGSMASIKDDTIGAFNTYISTLQADPAGLTFSFLQFDTMSIDTIHKNVPMKDALPLTDATFTPRGGTPLIDACVKTIRAVEKAVAERNDPKVVICFQTDGQENSSTQHTWAELNALIKEKSALGWQFNFLGAGIDAYAQSRMMGIAAINTMSYDASDRQATMDTFAASAQNTRAYASGLASNTAYSMGQRAAAKDAHIPDSLNTPKAPVAARPVKAPAIVDDVEL